MLSNRIPHFPARAAGAAILGLAALLAGSCSVDVRDGAGPQVPPPDVSGTVTRDGRPAVRLEVEIRDVIGRELYETDTDVNGEFRFYGVPNGYWEIKVDGDRAGDFSSLVRVLDRIVVNDPQRVGRMDVYAYGAYCVAPASGDSFATPSPFQPLAFRWKNPALPGTQARVQVHDLQGDPVWFSTRTTDDSTLWNGLGNRGDYDQLLVPAGAYEWRLKFDLPDSSEARTERRALFLK